jgi:N6-L-threonylcarbamoyladenine synthase
MIVLGIETSCDECAAALVSDGAYIHSNIVASQIDFHTPYMGVVPEIASRLHTEWIYGVVKKAIAGCSLDSIDAIAVTNSPGLAGALLVGISFAKALAFSIAKPIIGINHVLAHLYAPMLSTEETYGAQVQYPFIGLMVSGGHCLIAQVNNFDDCIILGTTVDDAIGEAFDKVAKFYNLGYPGGIAIDTLARQGNPNAYRFPEGRLFKGAHKYDVSYSGLKTAVIRQKDKFHNNNYEQNDANLAAAFEKAAVDMLINKLLQAVADTGITRIVAGGGVAANTYLRKTLQGMSDLSVHFPPVSLCGDNAAMIAGLAYHYLKRGDRDDMSLNAFPRISSFRNLCV